MLRRIMVVAAGAFALACGGSEDLAPTQRQLPAGLPSAGALLRLPAEGGSATLLWPDSLTPVGWQSTGGLPPIARGLGTDLDELMVYAVDDRGRLIGVDLLTKRFRPFLVNAREMIGTPDGVILGLDSTRRPLRFANRSLTTFRAAVEGGPVQLLRAPSSEVVAYSPRSELAQVISEEGELRRFAVPSGAIASTWYGDFFVVVTDSGIIHVQPGGDPAPRFASMKGGPTVAAFSPSGHRLYVARSRDDLVMLDRFSGDELKTLTLPGTARALRVDRTGRWLLGRPLQGDSIWVVDLVRWEVAATVQSTWADDLPLVAGSKALIVRDGEDLVAWDLLRGIPGPVARLRGAAADVYLVVPWLPKGKVVEPEPVVVAAAPDSVVDTATTVAIAEPPVPAGTMTDLPRGQTSADKDEPTGQRLYLQVSASQNQDFAQALVDQLKAAGWAARVMGPKTPDDPYRVVIGPYRTREEADADGRRLGRTYFIFALDG
ncbi:MAG: SPOR domain-containing protein [Gemmatimonadales bacterium]|nr:SPOR domain-containing protein [Gemmatimonadales bacterium]